MSARLVFWYEFASTYSYPAAMRIERLATAAGVAVEWRPFLLGPIFQQQGWRDSPFNLYPAKGRYMWRDLERLCAVEHLPLRRPSVFPRNGLLAARVASIARDEGWCEDFSRAVYHANFAEDREIADAAVIGDIIRSLDRDSAPVLERAGSAANKDRLRVQTDDAMARGIFGAPSFTIGDELFWGNDRLEQAIAWAKKAST
ncbi:MAG TPA: 2-hydroxychromene-2-carboxylate isomerase [Stellaceae bacterium]|nr:2-hydroxychromene-2-carboxylate isomerase [Stellaceae bacterium]